jgi:hypothetical protein
MRVILVASVALSLCSCAQTLAYEHVGPGASDQETMTRTLARCKSQAALIPEEGAVGGLMAMNTRDNCMRADGWVRKGQ